MNTKNISFFTAVLFMVLAFCGNAFAGIISVSGTAAQAIINGDAKSAEKIASLKAKNNALNVALPIIVELPEIRTLNIDTAML